MLFHSPSSVFFIVILQVFLHVRGEKSLTEPQTVELTRVARESQIFDDLFNQPNSSQLFWVRPPGQNGLNKTTVNVSLTAVDLIDVDESQGKVEVTMWVGMGWQDSRLAWSTNSTDPDEPVKRLRVPLNLIWSPDLTGYDAQHLSEARDQDTTHGIKALIHMDGIVLYFPRHRYRMSCDFNLKRFPNDDAICNLTLGLWTYGGSEVELNFYGQSNTSIIEFTVFEIKNHSDWTVTGRYSRNVKFYACCPEPFVEIHVGFHLKRKSTFFVEAYLIAPGMLAALLPWIHLLPPDNPTKINFAALACLGLIIMASTFVTNVPTRRPPGQDIGIVTFYLYGIMLFLLSILVSCITASIAHSKHTSYRVHACFRRLLDSLVMRKICCLGGMAKFYEENTKIHLNLREDEEEIVNGDALASHHERSGEGVETIVKFLRVNENRRQLEREWYQLALIIDRFASIAFVLFFIVDTFV